MIICFERAAHWQSTSWLRYCLNKTVLLDPEKNENHQAIGASGAAWIALLLSPCRVSQPGWGLSAEALVGLRSAPRHWLRRSGVRGLRCGFGWQSPHKRLQRGPYTRLRLMGRSSVGQSGWLISSTLRVRVLPSRSIP